MRLNGGRKGSVVVLVAFLMIALLGFGAFAVDISQMQAYKSELQRTADAAALAGALQLGDDLTFDLADDSAIAFARANRVMGDTVESIRVEYGRVHGADFRSFTCNPACSRSIIDSATAIRIEVRGSGRFYLAQMLGQNDFSLSASATAWLPVDVVPCVAPWSVEKTVWDAKYGGNIPSPTQLRRNPLGNEFILKNHQASSGPHPPHGYGAINLPAYPALATNPSNGIANYQANIPVIHMKPGDLHCRLPAVGDFVQRKSLALDQQTVDGLRVLCAGPLPGDCVNAGGQIGVGVRVPIIEDTDGPPSCDDELPSYIEDDFGGKADCAVITDIRTFVVIRTPTGPGEFGRVLAVYAGTDVNGPVRGYAQRPILVQ